jgi:hypothetical protein
LPFTFVFGFEYDRTLRLLEGSCAPALSSLVISRQPQLQVCQYLMVYYTDDVCNRVAL